MSVTISGGCTTPSWSVGSKVASLRKLTLGRRNRLDGFAAVFNSSKTTLATLDFITGVGAHATSVFDVPCPSIPDRDPMQICRTAIAVGGRDARDADCRAKRLATDLPKSVFLDTAYRIGLGGKTGDGRQKPI